MSKDWGMIVRTKGTPPLEWFRMVDKRVHLDFQEILFELSVQAKEKMQQIINNAPYNLSALSNAIEVEILDSKAGLVIGIGNITKMPVGKESGASYWEAFESGFLVTQANIGYFGDGMSAPQSGGSGEKWHHTGKGSGFYLMQPNKIINPLSYISISAQELKDHINREVSRLYKQAEF